MKSYQFFKIYKHFDKERGKTLVRLGPCFTTDCFIKAFNPLSANFTKWSKARLSVFDHFVKLALKGLK